MSAKSLSPREIVEMSDTDIKKFFKLVGDYGFNKSLKYRPFHLRGPVYRMGTTKSRLPKVIKKLGCTVVGLHTLFIQTGSKSVEVRYQSGGIFVTKRKRQ